MLSSRGKGFAVALPSRPWRGAAETRGPAPDTSHTQSGLRGSSEGRRRSARAGRVPAVLQLSDHLFHVSPLASFPVLTELKCGHEVKVAFAYRTHATFRLRLPIFYFNTSLRSNSVCFCLINKVLMVCHTLFQHALIAQYGIIKVVNVQAKT